MRCLVLTIVALVAASTYAQAPVEVVDGRADPFVLDTEVWQEEPAVVEAHAASLRYWRALAPTGDWDFRVDDAEEGAFTRPGAIQTAVLYRVGSAGNCCSMGGLAVLEGGRLVRNVAIDYGGDDIRALPDVNGNGRSELVLSGGGGGQGVFVRSVFVEEFGDDRLERWGQLFVYESTCGAGRPGATATRLLVVPGATPHFRAETYEQEACADDFPEWQGLPWQAVGGRADVEMDEPLGEPAVDLPVR